MCDSAVSVGGASPTEASSGMGVLVPLASPNELPSSERDHVNSEPSVVLLLEGACGHRHTEHTDVRTHSQTFLVRVN